MTAVSAGSSGWVLPRAEARAIERETVDGIRAEYAVKDAEAQRLRDDYATLVRPRLEDTERRMRVVDGLMTTGAFTLAGAILGGVTGPSWLAGATASRSVLGGIALGAAGATMLGGIIGFNMAMRDISHAQVLSRADPSSWPAAAQEALKGQRSDGTPHDVRSWTVGGADNGALTQPVETYVEQLVTWDHDRDGAIDLRDGSPELRHDAQRGGAVGREAQHIEHLPEFLIRADTDGDARLTPQEAIPAVVREALENDPFSLSTRGWHIPT